MKDVNSGKKDARRVAAAPFPPATEHDDMQDHLRRVVPSSTSRPPSLPSPWVSRPRPSLRTTVMDRELVLNRGVVDGVEVKGAPDPPVDPARLSDRQPRPRVDVVVTRQPLELRALNPQADVARGDGPDPHGNPDPVIFHQSNPSDTVSKRLTNAADVSGAGSEAGVITMTLNWNCDVSNDDGASWTRLDPTTIFPETLGDGFCCDQVIIYVPRIDRFIWFLQEDADASGQGAFRIAAASWQSVRNDPTASTYWDVVASDFGYATSDMDYPDLAYSSRFLYASTDVYDPGSAIGRLVARIPLPDLAAGGSIGFEYTIPAQSASP
jgi:hypothetical protein